MNSQEVKSIVASMNLGEFSQLIQNTLEKANNSAQETEIENFAKAKDPYKRTPVPISKLPSLLVIEGTMENGVFYADNPSAEKKIGNLYVERVKDTGEIYRWDGLRYIKLFTSVSPTQGEAGEKGKDGLTPYISGGYWYIGESNTGVRAEGIKGDRGDTGPQGPRGEDGKTPTIEIKNGYWYINGHQSIKATVDSEDNGGMNFNNVINITTMDGIQPSGNISHDDNGLYSINLRLPTVSTSTGSSVVFSDVVDVTTIPSGSSARASISTVNGAYKLSLSIPKGDKGTDGTNGKDGKDGATPYIGDNGNWWIDGKDTNVQASSNLGLSNLSDNKVVFNPHLLLGPSVDSGESVDRTVYFNVYDNNGKNVEVTSIDIISRPNDNVGITSNINLKSLKVAFKNSNSTGNIITKVTTSDGNTVIGVLPIIGMSDYLAGENESGFMSGLMYFKIFKGRCLNGNTTLCELLGDLEDRIAALEGKEIVYDYGISTSEINSSNYSNFLTYSELPTQLNQLDLGLTYNYVYVIYPSNENWNLIEPSTGGIITSTLVATVNNYKIFKTDRPVSGNVYAEKA